MAPDMGSLDSEDIDVLVVDPGPFRRRLTESLRRAGYHSRSAEDYEGALEEVRLKEPHYVITELQLGGCSGFQLLEYFSLHHERVKVIFLTAFASVES